jgi:hypothetical protein
MRGSTSSVGRSDFWPEFRSLNHLFFGVMAGLVPAIQVLRLKARYADARDNPRIKSGDGHDGGELIRSHRKAL